MPIYGIPDRDPVYAIFCRPAPGDVTQPSFLRWVTTEDERRLYPESLCVYAEPVYVKLETLLRWTVTGGNPFVDTGFEAPEESSE